jgi:cytochrome c-type biogenesis protein CcmH/NrfG
MANQTDLAIDVLGLNLHVYPRHIDTYLNLARMYRRKGDVEEARRCLARAAVVEPTNSAVAAMLDMIQ